MVRVSCQVLDCSYSITLASTEASHMSSRGVHKRAAGFNLLVGEGSSAAFQAWWGIHARLQRQARPNIPLFTQAFCISTLTSFPALPSTPLVSNNTRNSILRKDHADNHQLQS